MNFFFMFIKIIGCIPGSKCTKSDHFVVIFELMMFAHWADFFDKKRDVIWWQPVSINTIPNYFVCTDCISCKTTLWCRYLLFLSFTTKYHVTVKQRIINKITTFYCYWDKDKLSFFFLDFKMRKLAKSRFFI